MRKYLLFILFVSTSFGQIISTTEDGKKVLLESNGTWRFFEDTIILQKNKNKIFKKILNFNEFIELSNGCHNSKKILEAIELAKAVNCKGFITIGTYEEYGKLQKDISEDIVCDPKTEFGNVKYALYLLS